MPQRRQVALGQRHAQRRREALGEAGVQRVLARLGAADKLLESHAGTVSCDTGVDFSAQATQESYCRGHAEHDSRLRADMKAGG